MINRNFGIEYLNLANRLFKCAETKSSQVLTNFLGNVFKEGFDELWLASKTSTEFRVLSCNTDWAGIKMADAHHDAARNNERCSSKTEFFATQESCNNNIAASLHLTIDLYNDAITQTVEHQCLLSLGKTKFPRSAGMLERGQRRCAGSAIVSRDQHNISMCLRDTSGNSTDANLCNELDVNSR